MTQDCNCKNKSVTVEHILDTDVDDLSTIPDYFLAIRTVEDPSTGATIATPVRVPGEKVIPSANLANVIALTTNNDSLEVPENQVLAGYYDTQATGSIMRLADSTHPAQFLMVKNYTNGKMLVQTTGFLTISAGHSFIVGQTYYLGEDGQPVTDSTVTGQRLFVPLDEYTLNVNMEF